MKGLFSWGRILKKAEADQKGGPCCGGEEGGKTERRTREGHSMGGPPSFLQISEVKWGRGTCSEERGGVKKMMPQYLSFVTHYSLSGQREQRANLQHDLSRHWK